MNTLRGVFPEPKVTPKRNFIQENMRQLRQMQGIYNKVEMIKPTFKRQDKYQSIPARVCSFTASQMKPKESVVHSASTGRDFNMVKRTKFPLTEASSVENAAVRQPKEPRSAVADIPDNKVRDMGVQTESGIGSRYRANFSKKAPLMTKEKNIRNQHSGDTATTNTNIQTDDPIKKFSGMKLNESTKTIKNRPKSGTGRQNEVPTKNRNIDPDCPPGHVTIPETERKETLRALRQSYADLVAELNLMPVKTDTLRTRNRKIELEKQLNKIEEGIKVFSRPKVYVKINS